ncbi:hypothetical protein D4740_04190 [Actinomyces sp. 2119]|uniref:Uncharacterized protein n=1 Tax=Actinomyces lilanjuaniae TaxID=2321394 RepID=A0ABM6Z2T1_9ACTO|nr:hypothetical protein D5R93_04875 [Actinomyces lilanjuaniae]RJF43083.1 hypothetical protein D4740_04190 [Actinomyces sp. 2119]
MLYLPDVLGCLADFIWAVCTGAAGRIQVLYDTEADGTVCERVIDVALLHAGLVDRARLPRQPVSAAVSVAGLLTVASVRRSSSTSAVATPVRASSMMVRRDSPPRPLALPV